MADMAHEQYDTVVKTITVKLPEPLASWLSRRARELHRSQSDLVQKSGGKPADLLAWITRGGLEIGVDIESDDYRRSGRQAITLLTPRTP
jgi:hypothetical protein